jgi:large repetitive protein
VSPTQITAVTPRGKSGLTAVTVTTADGAVTAANAYDYTEILKVVETGTNFAHGPTSGGLPVTITGRGFGFSGIPVVTFNGELATSVVRSHDGLITAVTPPGSPGPKTVVVQPADGGLTITKPSSFTYRAPTITAVAPGAGFKNGGTTVTITGTGFGFSGTPTVTFAGTPATSVNRISSTELTAVTPAGSLGLVDVVLAPALGTGTATAAKAYEYVESLRTPLVDNVVPNRGPATGGTSLSISGNHFNGSNNSGITVFLGGQTISGVTVSPDGKSLVFSTPSLAAGTHDLRIKTNEGEVIYRNAFYAAPAPSFGGANPCAAVSPRIVNYTGANSITISGSGFKDPAIVTHPGITVSGVTAAVTSSSNTSIVFTLPNVPSGYRDIVVTPNNGASPVTLSGCLLVRRLLYVSADSKSINVGEPSPAFTFATSGLISPDAITSTTFTFTGRDGTTYGPSTTAPTAVGRYTITPSAAVFGTGSADRYDMVYLAGIYEIFGVLATVTADDKTITYGQSSPTFTSEAAGLTSGDVLNNVTYEFQGQGGTPYARSSTPPTQAGTYTIFPVLATVTPSGNTGRYTFTYLPGTLTINRKPVTMSAQPKTKVYSRSAATDPELTFTVAGLVSPDTLVGNLTRAAGENVGEYNILQGTVSNTQNPNYDITFVSAKFSITPKPITVTMDSLSKMYGDSDPSFTYTSAGLISPDSLTGSPTRVPGENVGTYTISSGTLSGGTNYTISGSIGNGTLTVTKRDITIVAANRSFTYGDTRPANAVQLAAGYSLAFTDTLSGATFSYSTPNPTTVGEYGISPSSAVFSSGSALNYNITYEQGSLTINPRPLTVRAENRSVMYGNALGTNTLAVVAGSLASGDAITSASYTYSPTSTPTNAGTYTIRPDALSITAGRETNYQIVYQNGALTIERRVITVAADAKTKIYNDADPELTYVVTEGSLVAGDTLTLTRNSGENVGSYPIRIGTTTTDNNYNVTFTGADLVISPKPITVTVDAKSKIYGNADPAFTYTTSPAGFTVALTRAPGSSVGTYAITLASSGLNNNYTVTFTGADLTIDARPITLKPGSRSVEYGSSIGTNTNTVSVGSLAAGDSLVSLEYTYSPDASPVAVGTYTITPSNAAITAGRESNYDITYDTGTLTITKRAITLRAENKTSVYGETTPENTWVLSAGSLVDGESIEETSVQFSYDTASPVNAGTYTITPSDAVVQNGSADNYNITYQTGTLTISRKAVSVQADDQLKIYGDTDPVLTFVATGMVGFETLSGSLTRNAGENVGERAITRGTVTNASNPNYDITFTGANLTISKKPITVQADTKTKVFGDSDPALTFVATGLVGADALAGSLTRDAGEDVGTYPVNQGTVTNASNPNYDITFTGANLTITRRSITITPDSGQSKEYGSNDPTLTFTVKDTGSGAPISLTLEGELVRAPGENVGEYAISQGSVVSTPNYLITFTTGVNFEVTKRALTILAENRSIVYGNDLGTNTWRISSGSLLDGDEITSVEFAYSQNSTPVATPRDAGSYTIAPENAVVVSDSLENYLITYETGTLTIEKRLLTLAARDRVGYFGSTLPVNGTEIVSGELVLGDEIDTVTFTYGPTTTPSQPGVYTITPSEAQLTDGNETNYTIFYTTGVLEIEAASVRSMTPIRGIYLGGTPFTITGQGFGPAGTTATVKFSVLRDSGMVTETALEVTVVNSTTVTGITPEWALLDPEMPETVDVELTIFSDSGRSSGSFDQIYTYLPPVPVPEVLSLSPLTGPSTGGTQVTLVGRNLVGSDGQAASVYIDGLLATNPVVNATGTSLTVTIPPNASDELYDVDVVTDLGSAGFVEIFEYYPPVLDEVRAPRGYTVGGARVRLIGQHFGPNTGTVFFGANQATVISWSQTEVIVSSPAGNVGKVEVRVVPATGPDQARKADGYEYVTPPSGVITGVLWLDLNKNGKFDPDTEPVLPNTKVSVSLSRYVLPAIDGDADTALNRAASASAQLFRNSLSKSSLTAPSYNFVTDANGRYETPEVVYGSYTLRYTIPSDLVVTYAPEGSVNGALGVMLQQPRVEADTGLAGTSSLAATVVDNYGILQLEREVVLRWAGPDGKFDTDDDVLVKTRTSKKASLALEGLPAGSYRVDAVNGKRWVTSNVLKLQPNKTLKKSEFVLPSKHKGLPTTGTNSNDLLMLALQILVLGVLFTTAGRFSRRKVARTQS